MTGPLLETKLYAPRPRRGLVHRARLSERLERGAASTLTLISAPAGFGKTTLLAAWLAADPAVGRSVAWLSLDQADNQQTPFWTNVIAALQTVAPEVGTHAQSLLTGTQAPTIETVLATLLNELSAVPGDVVLVLDDYHVIDAPDIQEGMAYLLEHLPPRLHVVITTRADPVLPLARLRARGELVEIRAADLRFRQDEAAAYLNEVMGLDLAPRDVAALEGRTEGWIAALQLAALSMEGRDDTAGFIASFAGDDRYIVDYLVEEVLRRQPADIRSFLLETSILDRLSGPLVDTVTGQEGGKATLESLDRGNLFLIPLDDRRQWYRYHHLFADVLRAHLLDERPDHVPLLHRRASDWFEQHAERHEAIRHALAAEDFDRAAALIELALPATNRARQEITLRQWLEALPDDVIRMRPVLCDGYAGSILVRGETDGAEQRLRDAERWLGAVAEASAEPGGRPSAMVVADEEAFRDLPVSVAIHRAGQARLLGDEAGTMAHARRALELVRDDGHLAHGAAAALLGLSYWTSGDLAAAHRHCVDAMTSLERAGYHSDVLGLALTVADIETAQGRLRDAMRTYERGVRISVDQGVPALRGTADMLVGMSAIWRERDDLEAARERLRESRDLGEQNGFPQNPYRSRVAMARVLEAEGDVDGALELLEEAERVYAGDFSPNIRPVPATKARVWIAHGRLQEAFGWARDHGLAASDDLSYVHEFEHVTLAKLLLAHGARERDEPSIRTAMDLLQRLLAAAVEGQRHGSVIGILVVQALAHHATGDMTAALVSLARAIGLAEPEGYVRIFLDEGPPMAALLKQAAKQPNATGYVRRLLDSVVTTERARPAEQPLIEPLSERELDVLRLLDSDLTGPAIASELVVSLATVRTHTRNIYAKLGVNNRMAAVRRAGELGLLSRTQSPRTVH